jgi:hypothetical protein
MCHIHSFADSWEKRKTAIPLKTSRVFRSRAANNALKMLCHLYG